MRISMGGLLFFLIMKTYMHHSNVSFVFRQTWYMAHMFAKWVSLFVYNTEVL